MTITEEIKERKLNHEGLISYHNEQLARSLKPLVGMGLRKDMHKYYMENNARALKWTKAIANVCLEMLGQKQVRAVNSITLRDEILKKEYAYEEFLGLYLREIEDMKHSFRHFGAGGEYKNYYENRLFLLKEIAKKLYSIALKS